MKGHVVSWNEEKKFGFIKDENGVKYFLHASQIKDKNSLKKIKPHDLVYFKSKETDQKLRAIEVKIAKK